MGLSTERKVFFGIVGIAGLALIIDQGILGPSEASADLPPITGESLDESALAGVETQSGKPAAAILIDRLRSGASSDSNGSFGSAFSLTKLIQKPKVEPGSDEQADQGEETNPADQFPLLAPRVDDLPVLSSVMPTSNGGGAVLGGKLVRVGQVGANGCRLLRVYARSVLVERDGVEYTIEIPTISGRN